MTFRYSNNIKPTKGCIHATPGMLLYYIEHYNIWVCHDCYEWWLMHHFRAMLRATKKEMKIHVKAYRASRDHAKFLRKEIKGDQYKVVGVIEHKT